MFHQPGRLTAVAIRLRDPALLREASARLQNIPGAQVVTLTEMMGTFLNLVGAVRTLLFSHRLVALAVSVLGVFNTLLASVLERTGELAVLRAIGLPGRKSFGLIATEALLLTGAGGGAGIVACAARGPRRRRFRPSTSSHSAPTESLFSLDRPILLECVASAWWWVWWRAFIPPGGPAGCQPAQALKGE